jgi:hypothetical protein
LGLFFIFVISECNYGIRVVEPFTLKRIYMSWKPEPSGPRGIWVHVLKLVAQISKDGEFTTADVLMHSKLDLTLQAVQHSFQVGMKKGLVEKLEGKQKTDSRIAGQYYSYKLTQRGWDYVNNKMDFKEVRQRGAGVRGFIPVSTWIAPLPDSMGINEVVHQSFVTQAVTLASAGAKIKWNNTRITHTAGNEAHRIDQIAVRIYNGQAEETFYMNVEELKMLRDMAPAIGVSVKVTVFPLTLGLRTLSLGVQKELGTLIRKDSLKEIEELPDCRVATPMEIQDLVTVYGDYFQLLET